MKKARTNKIYRQVIAASLLAGSTFQLAAPVLALTAAGTGISNTATATYQDPIGNTIDATSNTVNIVVAEVAGITVTPNSVTKAGGSAGPTVNTGDTVNFDYNITNTGNDPTQFFIPSAPSLVQGGTAGTIQIVAYDPDGPSGPSPAVTLTTPVNVTAGASTATLLAAVAQANNGVIPAGASLVIRVPVTVTADTSGAPIKVVIGDTAPNDNSAATQNQPDATDGANTNEIRTVDNADGVSGEAAGAPTNGQREASAFQQIFLAAAPKAFATILKTNTFQAGVGAVAPNGTITYNLSLDVAKTSPDSQYVAAPLKGTNITVNGLIQERILVSDVIPAGTTFKGITAGTPTNWIPVYSIDNPVTTANSALETNWTTTAPSDLTTVRRVGFIYDATTTPITNGDGIEVTGLKFEVTTSASANATVYNIAQVFGQTNPTDPADKLVYDESGDAQPNNYNGPNDPGTDSNLTPTGFKALNTDSSEGVASSINGVDNTANNTGTGPGGEANPLIINITPPGILNGPQDQPTAVGPSSNNDDFTNKSIDIPAGTIPTATINPAPISFTNTVNNPGATNLNNILVRPIPPADAALADIPNGTTVTITLGNNTGVYTYNLGTNTYSLTSGSPISIPTLTPGQSLDYTVTVDLPAGTLLSTNDADGTPGIPVSIVAFIDNGDGTFNPAQDTNYNTTVDRIYTGYLKLLKEARILDSAGNPVTGAAGSFSDGVATAAALQNAAQPGNIIEYRIRYQNVSEPSSGVGNIILNANNTVITENGSAGGNTWFGPTKDSVYPTNPTGSATATGGSIVITDNGGDIQIYTNNVGSVAPNGGTVSDTTYNGNLTFRRLIK